MAVRYQVGRGGRDGVFRAVSHGLLTLPWSTAPMLEVFSDKTILRLALTFETALAHAQSEAGLMSAAAAAAIAAAADALRID